MTGKKCIISPSKTGDKESGQLSYTLGVFTLDLSLADQNFILTQEPIIFNTYYHT